MKIKTLAFCAALASISATVQLIHIGYLSPSWGMWIDFVAVTWIIAFFLYGLKASVLVSLFGSLVITLFSPDTWLGASMKFAATLPVILVLFAVMKILKKDYKYWSNLNNLKIPVLLAILIRVIIVIPLNYYYAIPIWTNMSPIQAMMAIPWWVIASFNAIQTIVDVFLAWLLVYRFKLIRYREDAR